MTRTRARKAASWLVRAVGPLVLTAGPYLAWVPLNRAIVTGGFEPGLLVWVALLPALGLELLAHLYLDAPAAPGEARKKTYTLGARTAALVVYFYMLVARPAGGFEFPEPYMLLVGYWPDVARFPFIASPVLGSIGIVLIVGLHIWFTVIKRKLRFTTVIIVPSVFIVLLFQFQYAFPVNALHMVQTTPEEPFERVFPFEDQTNGKSWMPPFFPRSLVVSPDEKTVIASFGVTFRWFLPEQNPNMARFDIDQNDYELKYGDVIRRFHSTCYDKVFMSEWHHSSLLEVNSQDFSVKTIELPPIVNGHIINEINYVFHDCDSGRVFVGNSLNPVVFVWNTKSNELEKIINLVGVNGIRFGDPIGHIFKNPVTHDIYVGMHGAWNLVELDASSLDPVRFMKLPAFPFEFIASPDGKWLYIQAFFDGTVWKVDAASLEVVDTLETPIHCRRLELSKDGRWLLALSYLTGELVRLDAYTGQELDRFLVGPRAEALALSEHFVWVFAASGLFRAPVESILP